MKEGSERNLNKAEEYVREKLFELRDEKYKNFQSKLIPTIDSEKIIGVRTPALRKFSKEFSKSDLCEEFLESLPHKYYDENNLHGFIIEQTKDYGTLIKQLDKFLPYVDNWATCDLLRPKIFKKPPKELTEKIKEWISSEKTYLVRFGIEMLMTYYLDDNFKIEYAKLVTSIKSEEYYVNMMISWYIATALSKQYELIIPFLENRVLEKWVHNKSIQKAVESFRITNEQKAYLRSLRIK